MSFRSGPLRGAAVAAGTTPGPRPLPRAWPLLLPAAYLAHLAEEHWGGFVAWASAWAPALTVARFVAINAVAWTLVLAVALLACARPALAGPALVATAVLSLNGALHAAASVATLGYSPGLVSGLLLYLPLGAVVLGRAEIRRRPGGLGPIFAAAVAVHLAVVWVASGGPP